MLRRVVGAVVLLRFAFFSPSRVVHCCFTSRFAFFLPSRAVSSLLFYFRLCFSSLAVQFTAVLLQVVFWVVFSAKLCTGGGKFSLYDSFASLYDGEGLY